MTPGYTITHPERRYTLKPHFTGKTYAIDLKINSFGLRDYEKPIRDDAFRIAVFGDSITFGQGVSTEKTFPKVVEQQLNDHYHGSPPVQVFNFGIPSYNTVHEFRYMKEALPLFKPNMIIVEFTAQNDTLMTGDELSAVNKSFLVRLCKDILRHLYSYDFLAARVYGIKHNLTSTIRENKNEAKSFIDNYQYQDDFQGWIEAKKAFGDIKALCDSNHIMLLFTIFANNNALSPDPEHDIMLSMVSKVATVLKEIGINHIVVMDDAFRQYAGQERQLWVNPQDLHFSELAHKLAANQLSDYIQVNKLIPK